MFSSEGEIVAGTGGQRHNAAMTATIYLDFNATTPPAPEVIAAMEEALREGWGNPSSRHSQGNRARKIVEHARVRTASLLACHTDEIVFTSGGTESDHAAILGVAEALRHRGRHVVVSAIEHPAVEEACRALESTGGSVTRVGVDREGRLSPDDVERALREDTVLVSVMHANNETGVLQPIGEIAARVRTRGVLVHTDAAQSVGKIRVRVDDLGVDLVTVAGHKFHAPKGVGALYVRRGTPIVPWLRGGGQERGLRGGTEPVPAIAGLGAACSLWEEEGERRTEHLAAMRDRLERSLRRIVAGVVVHGGRAPRLPNTLSLSIPGVRAADLMRAVPELAISAGAACHEERSAPSSVLTAMGITPESAASTLRFSTGRTTTEAEVDDAVRLLTTAWKRLA
jgi:cysteine desulfurase